MTEPAARSASSLAAYWRSSPFIPRGLRGLSAASLARAAAMRRAVSGDAWRSRSARLMLTALVLRVDVDFSVSDGYPHRRLAHAERDNVFAVRNVTDHPQRPVAFPFKGQAVVLR